MRFFISILIILLSPCDKIKSQDFSELRKKYEIFEKNNENAFLYLNQYIQKAKIEKKNEKLVQGYKDCVFYSSSNDHKLKYADSTIIAAIMSQKNDLISEAYLGKGIIYYFNYKRYRSALDEYIKAYQYAKNTQNMYLKNKVIYHLGVVKSYLGYYEEALGHFKKCIRYFESNTKSKLHSNEIYNNSKGYLNSIHQSIICYRNLGKFQKSDSLISIGINFTKKNDYYTLENAYFFKCKGISEYHRKNYNKTINLLQKSLRILKKNNDFTWISVSEYYIGRCYLETGQNEMAIKQFKKVDSIIQKHQFILPELRENYELLIKYYKTKNNPQEELYFTKNLLKADNILSKDFKYISSKIHKEYDTQILLDSKNKLENQNIRKFITIIMLCIAIIILVFISNKHHHNQNQIKERYKELELKLQKYLNNKVDFETISLPPKTSIKRSVFIEIQNNLKQFEEACQFTEKGLSLNKLAQQFKTNSSYLSQYINETQGMNFKKYIALLRINHITYLMYNDKKYLRYSIQSLSEECGISSRQNFSDLFFEINSIRPIDFIKQRKLELEEQE